MSAVKSVSSAEQKIPFRACGVDAIMSVSTPDEVSSGPAIGIAPGYLAGHENYWGMQDYFASQSRIAFTVEAPHTHTREYSLHPNRQRSETLRIATNIILEQFDTDSVSLVGHSWGGSNVLSLLHRDNSAIESAVLLAPAGIIAAHEMLGDPIETSKWFLGEALFFATHPRDDAKFALSALHKAITHPLRLIQQGLVASEYMVADYTREFRHETPVGLVAFKKDPIFRHDKLLHHAEEHFDIVRSYDDENAGHFEPQKYPKRVGRVVLGLLDELRVLKASNSYK